MKIRKPPLNGANARVFTLPNGKEVEVSIERNQISVRGLDGPLLIRPVVANVVVIYMEAR